jgi:hypothetical protein
VPPVEPWRLHRADEELRAVGVRACAAGAPGAARVDASRRARAVRMR